MSRRSWQRIATWMWLAATPAIGLAQPPQADDSAQAETSEGDEPAEADASGGESAEGEDGQSGPSTPVTQTRVINEQERELQQAQDNLDREEASVRVIEDVDEEDLRRSSTDKDHRGQVEVRIGSGLNFLFAIRFKDGPQCEEPAPVGEDPEEFCHRIGEPFLDLEVGYGVTSKLEIALWVNLMLTEDPAADAKPKSFGIGLRGYTSEEATVKGYFGARLVFDVTKSSRPNWNTFDMGIRGEVGIHIDFIRWMGLYIGGGATVRFLRGFYLLPELGGGLQFRFP